MNGSVGRVPQSFESRRAKTMKTTLLTHLTHFWNFCLLKQLENKRLGLMFFVFVWKLILAFVVFDVKSLVIYFFSPDRAL